MPNIAIKCVSAGASVANVSGLTIAVSPPGVAYNVIGSGGGQTILLGAAVTSTRGGSRIPQIDEEGRAFPVNLLGKSIEFELAGGVSFRAPHRITIKIQSLAGSQPTLYEWEGRIPISSSMLGGFEIDGTLHTPSREAGDLYSDLMWGRNNHEREANDALSRAAERVNSRR